MGLLNKFITFLAYFLSLSLLSISNAITLDESGSYNLIVSIDETTRQNDSIENYVENIKSGIQDLSDLLHYTTNGKFSIKTADILVPVHWNVPTDGAATTQFYQGADIKISHRHFLPVVNNPNPCGRSGNDILLPYNFFDDPEIGVYGRLGKALLTLFVRLRFGAWEEHGYPGDSMFPYYWKPLDETEWKINACTDVPLIGKYQSVEDGSECGPDPDDKDNLYPPPGDCRFFPQTVQSAKSSLMSYHYLPNVEAFCNFTTHDRRAPTPQNYFCKYKSVMEVIETSPDWTQTTQVNVPGRVEMKVVKNTGSPLLYVLIDGGKSHAPVSVLAEISSRLKELFSARELRNLVAAVGRFPADNDRESFSRLVPWSSVGSNINEFMSAFDAAFGSQAGLRNFAASLRDVIVEIKSRNHKQGAVILVVKTGAEPNTADLTTELEVLALILDINIKVFAIEIQGNAVQPGIALTNLVEKSEGKHLIIGSLNDLQQPMVEFITSLKTTLQSGIQVERKYKLGMREILSTGSEIKISMKGMQNLFVYAIPLSGEISNPTLEAGNTGNYYDLSLEEFFSWGETRSTSKKSYMREEWLGLVDDLHWERFSFTCDQGNCRVIFIALLLLEDPSVVFDDINISVLTSAVNDEVDLAVITADTDHNAAFAIYAKVEQGGMPLMYKPGLSVTATMYMADGTTAQTIDLIDDGKVIPDVSLNDGVFSGVFIPNVDGIYKLLVTARYSLAEGSTSATNAFDSYEDSNVQSSSIGRLFPVDQNFVGCGSGILGCWSVEPEIEFVKTVELQSVVEFKNCDKFIALADRIHDFRITAESGKTITMEWTAPGVREYNAIEQAYNYEIKQTDSLDDLLFEFDNAENFPPEKWPFPSRPGLSEKVTHTFTQEAKKYIAIRTLSRKNLEDPSLSRTLSVIASVNIQDEVIATTTTTTTTTSPITSTTTTAPNTDSTVSSTIGDDDTTTVNYNRTTTARTTTARPTSPTTTTRRTTTTPPPPPTKAPEKHWYAQKEGIITISVFGGAIALLLAGGLTYLWLTKFR